MMFLVSVSFIYADDAQQVENAYTCLQNKIDQSINCSTFSFEEKVFGVLATGECINALSKSNITSNQCWATTGSTCNIKSTAEAILALNRNEKVNTTKAENWLLKQTASPTDIYWFLEIESPSATSCIITYSGSTYNVTIGENKKISKNAGSYLTLAQDNYWLRISPQIYNKEIQITCNENFITTLLFMRKDSSTVHVSDQVTFTGRGTIVTQQVNSLCFVQGGVCNYEGSLWAALALKSLGYDVSNFMPYLITMMDDTSNQKYIPESFLYFLTGKFRTELLLKQNGLPYWEASGNRYYDTALALLPFPPEDSTDEKTNSIAWLMGVQQKTGANAGCWNNGNFRDTAFLLFSIWPKDNSVVNPPGECQQSIDCPPVDNQNVSCYGGNCVYTDVGCINNDNHCGEGCSYANDNDCPNETCTTNSNCPPPSTTEPYCGDDGNSYKDVSTYSCDNSYCVENVDQRLIDRCSSSETCTNGECVPDNTQCVPSCSSDQTCVNGECVQKDDTCGALNLWSCSTGKHCTGGLCIPDTCEQTGCPDGQTCTNAVCIPDGQCAVAGDCPPKDCKDASCVSGTCSYAPVGCADGDSCCSAGCNYTNDNYCPPGPECTSNSDCSVKDYQLDPICSTSDGNVYKTFYNYTCENQVCVENITKKLVDACNSTESCWGGECYANELTPCTDNYSCNNEQCFNGECVPFECDSSNPCTSGTCTDGYCVVPEVLDCVNDGKGYCILDATCQNNGGIVLGNNYYCDGLSVCCDTASPSMTCADNGGEICASGQGCVGGTEPTVSDNLETGQTCCVGGTCQDTSTITYCGNPTGTCKSSCDSSTEEEKNYVCSDGGSCCVAKATPTPTPSRLWVWIVILLLLIGLSVVGIVFRDKLRVQWIKLKDKLGGKKEKKKFEMPLTSNPNPQGRILPRRILPPGQQQQRPFMRGPITPSNKPSTGNVPPSKSTTQQTKKPEEKSKGELDDVLKKLREMGK